MVKEPVLKTGARKGLQVRILSPPPKAVYLTYEERKVVIVISISAGMVILIRRFVEGNES